MQRFWDFWIRQSSPVSREAMDFLHQYHRVRAYTRGEIIRFADEDFPFLCIVLDGTVGGYQYNRLDKRIMRELALPHDFFTGTNHAFSNRRHTLEFVALKPTRLLLLPVARAREGQHLYREISELFHVLKQRKIIRLRKLVSLYQEKQLYERYVLLWDLLPEIAKSPHMTNATLAALLHISLSHFKRLKQRYVLEK